MKDLKWSIYTLLFIINILVIFSLIIYEAPFIILNLFICIFAVVWIFAMNIFKE